MSIIVILVSIAIPLYQKSILRTKESVLHNNLMTLRTTIDEYTYDKQKAPQASARPGPGRLFASRCPSIP
jgi:general secretion pathway protein G